MEDTVNILPRLVAQDKLIFRVCVETGLRISDVLKLRSDDVGKYIHVREQKTGKLRTVELSDELVAMLEAHRGSWYDIKSTDMLFPSVRKPSKSVHRSAYHRRLKKACKAVGVDFSAHSTRKLFAQELMRATGDIFLVQKALNHKFLTDTCNYLDIDLGDLIKAATELKQLLKK